MNAAKKASAAAAQKLNKLGMTVVCRRDDGSETRHTLTRPPWQLGHGVWVCGLSGISGGYDCARVRPAPPAA